MILFSENTLILDTGIIKSNYKKLTAAVGERAICVVKANAYGHGAAAVVKALYRAGARYFAVACMDEAVFIRKRALDKNRDAEVFVLGHVPKSAFACATKYNITIPIISEQSYYEILSFGGGIRCYLQIDTGMRRLGVDCREKDLIGAMIIRLKKTPDLFFSGVASHLYDGDSGAATVLQANRFSAAVGKENCRLSLCASAALLKNVVAGEYKRLGLCLYGYGKTALELGLEKALTLKTKIVRTALIKKGQTVGYNAVFRAKHSTLVGTLPIGYADGFMRSYRGANVFIGDKKCPVLAVCMDMTMIGLPKGAKPFDEVTVFSCEGNLENLTKKAGTIVYEGLTALGKRIRRVVR